MRSVKYLPPYLHTHSITWRYLIMTSPESPLRRRWFFAPFVVSLAALGGCGSSDEASPVQTPVAAETDVAGVDLTLFGADALQGSDIVDCELSDGTQTQCYSLRTSGVGKASDLIGPFCPETTSTGENEAGVWLDGTTFYEADGEFILDLANIYGQVYPSDAWSSFADAEGNVNITRTVEDCEAAANPNVGPEYAGFCVQCSLSDLTADRDLELEFLIPVTPQLADASTTLSASAGISLNGFQIAAQAPVEAILAAITVAPFDDCGGHVNPSDGYHYHAATAREGCNSAGTDANGHPAIMGYAMDGFGIYGPLPEGSEEADQLDQCNGIQDAVYGYHYHAGSPELNQHIGCFSGKIVASEEGAGGPRGPGGPGG